MNRFKKTLLVFLLVFSASAGTMIAYGQHSPNDSVIWIKRSDALRKLAQADSLSGYKQIVTEKQRDIDILQERISILKEVIKNLNDKDSVTMAVMKDQKTIYQDQLNGYEKLLRKERRKRKFVAGTALAVTGGLIYLLITK